MPQIELLDEQTIDKIAAGEVVERPSSVVKELVENAIDAGSSAVTVEIKDGGTSLIRITDNGCGIPADQISLAFYRHSTSKIRTADDLIGISSLGFRGEALSSISAVAQVELITKVSESITGSRYLIEGGKEISLEEIGAPNGTTFLIKNLFFNTPARKKFLRSNQTEAGYIADLMEKMALSHPEVSFRFISNGQLRISTTGNGQLKDVIYHIYGRDIAMNLLPVDLDSSVVKVKGYIGKPVVSRGNRNFESYFINGRYVKSALIAKSIEDAYAGYMMQHKYPFAVLDIDIDGTKVDVNVHPNKMELRFSGAEEIYENLYTAVRRAITHKEMIQAVAPGKETTVTKTPVVKKAETPEPFEKERLDKIRESIKKDTPYEFKFDNKPVTPSVKAPVQTSFDKDIHSESSKKAIEEANVIADKIASIVGDKKPENIAVKHIEEPVKTVEKTSSKKADEMQVKLSDIGGKEFTDKANEASRKIIGQLFDTYWLVELNDKFYIIDQHAAHEKILYEKTVKAYKKKEVISQNISPAFIMSLTMQEEMLLNKYMADFEKLGFVIEPYGGREYAVSAVPANLYNINCQNLLLELVDGLGSISKSDAPDIVIEKIASMSCKAAVKGNNRLSFAEATSLINELLDLENPFFCPHGRPVIVSMSKYEIEKKFKRIV